MCVVAAPQLASIEGSFIRVKLFDHISHFCRGRFHLLPKQTHRYYIHTYIVYVTPCVSQFRVSSRVLVVSIEKLLTKVVIDDLARTESEPLFENQIAPLSGGN